MALEAYRLRAGSVSIEESLDSLIVGNTTIPARRDTSRAMYIRYAQGIPQISVLPRSSFPKRVTRWCLSELPRKARRATG